MPSDFGTSSSSSYIYSVCANYIAADQQPQVTLIGNPYMYTARLRRAQSSRRYDIEILRSGSGRTGLYYYRARYYNPYIGRFTQLDPAREGMNWYAYCGNNSINCTDPLGLYEDISLIENDLPSDACSSNIDEYVCIGWMSLPTRMSPTQYMVYHKIKSLGFSVNHLVPMPSPNKLILEAKWSINWEFYVLKAGINITAGQILKPIAQAAFSNVWNGLLRASSGYYKGYIVLCKKKHFLWFDWIDKKNPIFIQVSGGKGWDPDMDCGAHYGKENAERAAKEMAELLGCYSDKSLRGASRGE